MKKKIIGILTCLLLVGTVLTVTGTKLANKTYTSSTFENEPPNIPEINGPTSGKVGETLTYEISAIDPNGDNVSFWIEWFQGCPGIFWQGPYPSGEVVEFEYTWENQGNHVISVRAKDTEEAESEKATLEVTIPRSKKILNHPIYDLFPMLQRIIQILI